MAEETKQAELERLTLYNALHEHMSVNAINALLEGPDVDVNHVYSDGKTLLQEVLKYPPRASQKQAVIALLEHGATASLLDLYPIHDFREYDTVDAALSAAEMHKREERHTEYKLSEPTFSVIKSKKQEDRTQETLAALGHMKEILDILLAAGCDPLEEKKLGAKEGDPTGNVIACLHAMSAASESGMEPVRADYYTQLANYLKDVSTGRILRPTPESVGLDLEKRNQALDDLWLPTFDAANESKHTVEVDLLEKVGQRPQTAGIKIEERENMFGYNSYSAAIKGK